MSQLVVLTAPATAMTASAPREGSVALVMRGKHHPCSTTPFAVRTTAMPAAGHGTSMDRRRPAVAARTRYVSPPGLRIKGSRSPAPGRRVCDATSRESGGAREGVRNAARDRRG